MLRRLLTRFRINRPLLPTTTTTTTTTSRVLFTRHYRTSTPRLSSSLPPTSPSPTTVSERLKHLIKSYGWYALGVYLVFSALDFTVAFVGIKLLGAEQVSNATAYVKQLLFGFFPRKENEPERTETETGHEGLYAMLVLAYTIHKTVFLPIRVGLTAALTPRIVGWLRARGWAGGQGAVKEMRERIRITKGRD